MFPREAFVQEPDGRVLGSVTTLQWEGHFCLPSKLSPPNPGKGKKGPPYPTGLKTPSPMKDCLDQPCPFLDIQPRWAQFLGRKEKQLKTGTYKMRVP